MRQVTLISTISFILFSHGFSQGQSFQYPVTAKRPVTDTYYHRAVVDNFQLLEDLKNKDVQDWFKVQHDYTNSWLDKIPGRDALFEDFKKLDALRPATISDISRKGQRYFYRKTLPKEKVGKLYYSDGKTGKEIL